MKAQDYFIGFLLLLIAKSMAMLILSYTEADFFGGGNDSYYYDGFARGYYDVAVNSWPIILRALHDISLYSRDGVSFVLKLLAFLAIPLWVGALCRVKESPIRRRVFWAGVLVVSAYPTINFLATDIYRDVFMIAVWIGGLFVFKTLSEKPPFKKKILLLILGLCISIALFTLRDYLGFAYFVALIFAGFYSYRKLKLIPSLFMVVGGLYILYLLGFLDPILAYREGFDEMGGGATLGIEFASAASFLPDFFRSAAAQLFGLHFVNPASVLVFLVETVPFLALLIYVILNKEFSNKFVDYLIVFFVAYACVWLLGNDNLGTAVRLRTFNYLAVLVAFFVIYQNKRIAVLAGYKPQKRIRFRLWPTSVLAARS